MNKPTDEELAAIEAEISLFDPQRERKVRRALFEAGVSWVIKSLRNEAARTTDDRAAWLRHAAETAQKGFRRTSEFGDAPLCACGRQRLYYGAKVCTMCVYADVLEPKPFRAVSRPNLQELPRKKSK